MLIPDCSPAAGGMRSADRRIERGRLELPSLLSPGSRAREFRRGRERSSTYQQLVAELFAVFTSGRGKRARRRKNTGLRPARARFAGHVSGRQVHSHCSRRTQRALVASTMGNRTEGTGRLAYWDTIRWPCRPVVAQFVAEPPALAVHSPIATSWFAMSSLSRIPSKRCNNLLFLGPRFAPSMVRFHEGKQSADNGKSAKSQWLPATSGLRDWRRDMPAEDVAVFEALAGASASRTLATRCPAIRCNEQASQRADRAAAWWDAPGRKRRPKQETAIQPNRQLAGIASRHPI